MFPRVQVFLLPEYLAITMEYAAGGDLFQLVGCASSIREDDAKWYFQQLMVAIDYCHRMVRLTPFKLDHVIQLPCRSSGPRMLS